MKIRFLVIITVLVIYSIQNVSAHCEIPCGIYGDSLRFEQIREDIRTVEKAIIKINELSEEEDEDYNQIVRWVVNKEHHAVKIQDVVSQYFLHQRIKIVAKGAEGYDEYIEQLSLLHQIAVYAMKAKQGTDLQPIEKLLKAVDAFEKSYFKRHKH